MRASAVLALLLCLLSAAAAATVEVRAPRALPCRTGAAARAAALTPTPCAQRPARRLLADEVVERDDTTDSAAALVTGFTAFDVGARFSRLRLTRLRTRLMRAAARR